MRIWRRRQTPSPEAQEAREGLEQARRDLARAEADNEPVESLSEKLVDIKRRNNFGPMITRALRGSE